MSNKWYVSCETTTEGNNNTECESNVLPNEITYVDPDYLKQLFMNLNQFRNDEKYCDFFFYMEDQRLCAHKVILSAASPFFNKRFRDGCICVENEGDGKDDDDTPSICDFDDDDDDDEDDDCFEDTCLDDPCLDDTCLDDVCLNDGKENPYRGSIEDEQSMFSSLQSHFKGRVNVAKEEPRNQYNSEQPVFCSIPEQFAEPETTAHVNFSSSSTCDEQNPQRGFQNRKFTRSLISRYMDEVPLRPNKSFTFGAKELSTSDDYRCTKQETVNSQICVDNKIKYTPAKQMCKKISLISQYIDEAPSSINQNFFPKATNSIKKATECSPCYTSFSYNPKPEPRNAKDREDECNMNAPKDECRLRWTCQDNEKKEEKENKDCEMQPLNCPQMRKRGKVPTKWPSRSVSSNDTKDEERGTNKRPSCTKEEEEKAGPIKPIRYDTKEQEIRVGNQPSRPACDSKKGGQEGVRKWCSKPTFSSDTKEEDRTSRTSRTWTTETDTRQKETDEDDFRDPDSFCCEEDENRKQCADNSSMCPLNTKEDVGGRWTTRSGETLSTTSTEAKEETEEPKTLSSDFKDKSRRESSLKSTNGSANTPSKDSLTYSIHTVDQKEDAAITSETEEWPEKIVEVCTPTFPNKTGNMKQEVQERKSCKCPPTYSDNTKEQRPSKTMKVSGICADNIKEEAKHMNEEEQPLRINKSFVCLTDTTEECTGRWTCTTFTKISGFVEEKAIVSMTGADSTKETSRGEWNEKESNGETTISRPCVGVTNEVPIRKNTSFVCLPEVKEGTVKRWLWKVDTKGNFAERWVCKGPNRTYDGPKCLCDTRKIAGYTDTNEVPIRKNKSFVCVPEISEQAGAGRTQGGGGSQWLWPDNDVESKSSTTCKCSKCAPKPKLVPRPDDDRDDMFAAVGKKDDNVVEKLRHVCDVVNC
uniref:BTB domain-containing protein n=1 Tax=Glossina brevipalpis TaxID=37001 RepID=A0A1A9WF27_9MUSC